MKRVLGRIGITILNELRRNLDEAVSKEDYESAATIRDEIRELESED